MNILDKIIDCKKIEVEQRKENCPIADLERSMFFNRQPYSFKKFITDPLKSGIIAEFKKKSPSRGIINDKVLPALVTKAYENAGASAVSVLTDHDFFGGSNKDLIEARDVLTCPILRKDFIIDEYQIVEAKSIGADAILLIAACLEPEKLRVLADFAKFLGLEVLMEVHNKEELLKNLHDSIDVVGVNNRNLKDFSESIENSLQLADLIPDKYVKISESSLKSAEIIVKLKGKGYKGFLIGETFMKTEDPGKTMEKLVAEIKEESLKLKV
ncbi:MAG TPA: indole-3-glycerol phosphate synthase TrpC [Cytophagaceae bacterium]|jgi:indole-3-glycerol phosphate synthase|nr:indole-3-glycerol phosphate synthase TrpC [Cytophagaceae bacterium]